LAWNASFGLIKKEFCFQEIERELKNFTDHKQCNLEQKKTRHIFNDAEASLAHIVSESLSLVTELLRNLPTVSSEIITPILIPVYTESEKGS